MKYCEIKEKTEKMTISCSCYVKTKLEYNYICDKAIQSYKYASKYPLQ